MSEQKKDKQRENRKKLLLKLKIERRLKTFLDESQALTIFKNKEEA
jgi:hypothetical protein